MKSKDHYKKNRLLWISIILIVIISLLHLFIKSNWYFFSIFLIGFCTFLFSLKEFLWSNRLGAIFGIVVFLTFGVFSLNNKIFGILFFPLYLFVPLIKFLDIICVNNQGWEKFDCLGIVLVSLGILIIIYGMLIGAYIWDRWRKK